MSFNRDLLPDPVNYFENLGHTLFGKTAKQFRTDCTIHGGTSPTLSVLRESGVFFCFSCLAKGSDVLAYEMQSTGADFKTAAKQLKAWTDDGKSCTLKPKPVSAQMMLKIVSFEVEIVAIISSDLSRSIAISEVDKQRLFKAASRINRVAEVLRHE